MSTMITGEAKKSFKAIVVKELPEKGILNNLYFVLNGDEGDNKYDEYIWIKDPDTQQYMWEKVGYSYVDLTPYYTKEEVDGKLIPITAHITNYDNPHQVTKDQVGLGNVDNTSDLDKPLSNKDKAALDLKIGSITFDSIGTSLAMNLYALKEPIELGSGVILSNKLLDTVQIPLVSSQVAGLMSPDKLGTIDYTYAEVNNLSSTVNFTNQVLNNHMMKIGSSVVDIGTGILDDSVVKTQASLGVGLVRGHLSDENPVKDVVFLNEYYGPEVVQYKYAGGQQFKRTIQSNDTASDWKVVGPTVIEVAATSVRLKDDTGAVISSSRLPVVGSDTGYGLLSSDTYNSLISIPEQLNSRIETAGVQYNEGSVVLGTANGQEIEIKEATSTTAGVIGTSLYQVISEISQRKDINGIAVADLSDESITIALVDRQSYPFSQVKIPPATISLTTRAAGVMSVSDKEKLDNLELTEPLADSDITALFS